MISTSKRNYLPQRIDKLAFTTQLELFSALYELNF